MDAPVSQGDTLPLENAADRQAVDAELLGELLDPSAPFVGGDKLGDLLPVEPRLRLLGRSLGPTAASRTGQLSEGPEAFYLVTEVRVSSHKVHQERFF